MILTRYPVNAKSLYGLEKQFVIDINSILNLSYVIDFLNTILQCDQPQSLLLADFASIRHIFMINFNIDQEFAKCNSLLK